MKNIKTISSFLVAGAALLVMSCGEPEESDLKTEKQDLSLFRCEKGHMWHILRCIPRQCHGRTSRSSDFGKCREDPSKPEVSLSVSRVGIPKAANDLQPQTNANLGRVAARARNKPLLYPAMEYKWSFDVEVRLADDLGFDEQFKAPTEPSKEMSFESQFERGATLAQKKLSFKVWLEDEFTLYDSGTRTVTTHKGFRCVANGFDIAPSDYSNITGNTRRYSVSFEGSLSEDCEGSGARLSRQNAARSSGLKPEDFSKVAGYKQTNIHVSYDVDGETVWHPAATTVDQVINGEPECEPNPIDLLYDPDSKTYKYGEFYKQRKTGTPAVVYIPDHTVGRLAQLGPKSVRARQDLTIRPFSRVSQPLTVDYEYYLNNFNRSHVFNPFNPTDYFTDKDSVIPGRAWRTHNLKTGNYAPTDLKAEFFLVPTDTKLLKTSNYARSAALEKYRLTTRALTKRDENTVVSDTLNFPITKAVQKRFLDPKSPSFVQNDRRSFTLAYCITSSASAFSSLYSPNYFGPSAVPSQTLRTIAWQLWKKQDGSRMFNSLDSVPNDLTALDKIVLDRSRFSLKKMDSDAIIARNQGWSTFDPGVYLPFFGNQLNNNSYLYGCRRDPRPLIITVDRFVSATEPISNIAYQGSLDAKETGDSSASGSNNNLHDIACERANPNDSNDRRLNDDDCDEMVQIGGKSAGSDTRSLYSVQSNSTREKGSSGSSTATASVRGEFMGFAIIDQANESSNPFQTGVQDALSGKVSFNIQPNWGNIADLLKKTNVDTPATKSEWKKGYGGEQNGLGYKLGFKIPFQIGPVPVVVIISFSIGANLSIDVSLQFKPDAADSYPCLGQSSDCAVLSSGEASFADANKTCQEQGGRLLEMSSQQEYDALQALRTASDGSTVQLPTELWVGGQTAYRVDDAKCANNGTNECKKAQDTEVRWISNSATIASGRGTARLDTTGWNTKVFGSGINFGGNHFPSQKGMYYDVAGNQLRLADKGNRRRFICRYDRADSQSYFKGTVGVPVTLAAGVGVSGCVPSGKEIFCLNGDISFVQFTLTPSFSYITHNIKRMINGITKTSKRSNAKLDATFQVTLFPATFSASLDVWITTLTWVIASFEGIKLPKQTLYEESFPSIGGWE